MADEATRIGRYVETVSGSEVVRAYVPRPLPPIPPIRVDALLSRLSAADQAVGRLDGISVLLPDKGLFLYMYVRKEAVLSSQIEGTQSTLSDLLKFEFGGSTRSANRRYTRGIELRLGYDVRPRPACHSAYIAAPHTRNARAPASKRTRPEPEPRGISQIAKLDWGDTPRQRPVRASATERGHAMPRRPREIHTRGHAVPPTTHQGRPPACSIRNHPSISRRQRTTGSTSDHLVSLLAQGHAAAAPIPQPLFQVASC